MCKRSCREKKVDWRIGGWLKGEDGDKVWEGIFLQEGDWTKGTNSEQEQWNWNWNCFGRY